MNVDLSDESVDAVYVHQKNGSVSGGLESSIKIRPAERPRAWTRRGSVARTLPGCGGRGLGDAFGFEPALGVDRGLAAVGGCGHGLAVAMVVDVARDEHAIDP